jgi:hypothetical protein
VTGAVDLRRLPGYAELSEPERVERAHQADASYFSRLAQIPPTTTLDHRWIVDESAPPKLALLARSLASTPHAALSAVMAAREQLAALPEHATGGAITDTDRLRYLLHPFDPAAGGLAEIRRRAATAVPARPDAHLDQYVAVPPFGWHPEQRSRALRALAEQPGGATLSVGLHAWRPSETLLDLLRKQAEAYARLARPAAMRGAELVGTLQLDPEPFAVTAAPLYTSAARSYGDGVFRVRVTLASPRPLSGELIHAVLGAFATSHPQSHTAIFPTATEADVAIGLLHGLGVYDPPAQWVPLLATLADPTEVAACCPMPAAASGVLLAPPVQDPSPERHAGSLHVSGDYVHGDKHGGDTIVAGGKHVHLPPGVDPERPAPPIDR